MWASTFVADVGIVVVVDVGMEFVADVGVEDARWRVRAELVSVARRLRDDDAGPAAV